MKRAGTKHRAAATARRAAPPATGRTRRSRVEARERAILDAAADVLASSGVEGATMSEIARQAGVAEGTVYLYFENKAALLGAVQAAFYARLTERAQAVVAATPGTRERLEALAALHLETLIVNHASMMNLLATYRGIDEYLARNEQYRFNRTYVAVFDGVIRDGINRGDLRADLPAGILRDLFYGTLEYMTRTMLLHGREEQAEETARGMVELLVGGIGDRQKAAASGPDALAAITRRLERAVRRLEGE